MARAHRRLVFRRAMRRFLRAPASSVVARDRVLPELIYGWGNEEWSAMDEYLTACVQSALVARGPILECGSGLSSLVVGAIAKQLGIEHWVLEHSPEWAAKVQQQLDRYGIDSARVCVAPLKNYGEFDWYDPPVGSLPDRFGLVICDGPPYWNKGGRVGLVPVLRSRLNAGCVILLDDAARVQEQTIAKRWAS
ncbi:MAG TPA: class I SAM-dependent methyltransferase, partial [Povalibacter sp.]|nr:class I SAM-dependent methyltransferase [Povalibacter sp.]